MYHDFSAEMYHLFSARMYQDFSAKMHHPVQSLSAHTAYGTGPEPWPKATRDGKLFFLENRNWVNPVV